MIDPKVVFEPVLGRWRVEYRSLWTDKWYTYIYHHTLEEACADAQDRADNDFDNSYRVVDTQPDAEDEHAPIVDHAATASPAPATCHEHQEGPNGDPK